MNDFQTNESVELEYRKMVQRVGYDFGLKRRSFMQLVGAGVLIASAATGLAQRSGRRGGFGGSGAKTVGARIHLGTDGSITVFVGKVEAGQGARAQLTQAAAEELCVKPERVQLIMADTESVPDDGITAGSGTSPRTVPSVRQGAAAARELFIQFAAKKWNIEPKACVVKEGKIVDPQGTRSLSYADFAADADAVKALQAAPPSGVKLIDTKDWNTLGKPQPRPNGRDLVTGAHKYPSDVTRPGMLYGKVLRAPSFGARLVSVDLTSAKAMKGVIAVRDDGFVGVAAPTLHEAEKALAAVAKTAKWETSEHISSVQLYEYLEKNVQGGMPKNDFEQELGQAKHASRQTYHVAYAQHAPLEPRAAVAEWADEKLTVWTGSQNPFGVRRELTQAFHIPEEKARVVVPDFGAGFGGKHSGEAAVEAARLAKAAGKPVSLRWTREEEFTWAYFRPAAVIRVEAGVDNEGKISSWHFININSGGSAVDTPYEVLKNHCRYVQSSPPLRHGSYRALAATANTFARECAMDELAVIAGVDPLEFRLAHLKDEKNARLRAVLEAAARRFNWSKRRKEKQAANIGIGLACGTEKGSFVAACAEVEIDSKTNQISVKKVSQAYDCGTILNPDNLLKQVQGAIVMGLGPALREEIQFENGAITTASFRKYQVPRFDDVPELDVELVNRRDLPSAGAGETPIIAIAPAIANAVFHVTNKRIRSMPIKL